MNVRHVVHDLLFSVPAIWFNFHIVSLAPFYQWTRLHQRFYPDGTPLLHQINKLFFQRWMSILLVCLLVSGAKFSVKKVQHYARWCFLLQPAFKKLRIGYKNIRTIGKSALNLLSSLRIEKEVPRKIKSNRVPPPRRVIWTPLYA